MISISDLSRDESDTLDELLARMSPDSRYQRFHTAVPVLKGTLRRALLDVDSQNHIALVARAEDGVVGIARLIRDPLRPDQAEIAVAVADAWHRRGVGRKLVEALIERAHQLGIRRVVATVLPRNHRALHLFRVMFPGCLTRPTAGAIELVGLIGEPSQWQITTEDLLGALGCPTPG